MSGEAGNATSEGGSTVRLVPYKSPRYIYAQATALNFSWLAAMSAARIVEEQMPREENVFVLPIFAMLGVTVLFYLAAAVWARFRKLELVPYAETLRRYFDDRSARSPFDTAWRIALHMGSLILIACLTIMPIEYWPAAVPIVGLALFLGFVAGIYSALYARRWREGTQNPTAVVAVSAAERSGRHYFGYALGLAAAFATAAYLEANALGVMAIIGAFVAGKFAGDLILPQPPYNFTLPLRVRLLDPVRYLIFGGLRWGVPLGTLCTLIAHARVPDAPFDELKFAFLMPLTMGALWGVSFWLVAVLARWGRKANPARVTAALAT